MNELTLDGKTELYATNRRLALNVPIFLVLGFLREINIGKFKVEIEITVK